MPPEKSAAGTEAGQVRTRPSSASLSVRSGAVVRVRPGDLQPHDIVVHPVTAADGEIPLAGACAFPSVRRNAAPGYAGSRSAPSGRVPDTPNGHTPRRSGKAAPPPRYPENGAKHKFYAGGRAARPAVRPRRNRTAPRRPKRQTTRAPPGTARADSPRSTSTPSCSRAARDSAGHGRSRETRRRRSAGSPESPLRRCGER